MLENIPEYMKGKLSTPTAHHLFGIAENATKLPQADADLFHHFVAQLLNLSKSERPDIHIEVSFRGILLV